MYLHFSEFWRVSVVVVERDKDTRKVRVQPCVEIFFLFNRNALNNKSKIFQVSQKWQRQFTKRTTATANLGRVESINRMRPKSNFSRLRLNIHSRTNFEFFSYGSSHVKVDVCPGDDLQTFYSICSN